MAGRRSLRFQARAQQNEFALQQGGPISWSADVFELRRDAERVKEEMGFYNPEGWVDEEGNPVMNENRCKLWRMHAAGLPPTQSPHIELKVRLAPFPRQRPAYFSPQHWVRFCKTSGFLHHFSLCFGYS